MKEVYVTVDGDYIRVDVRQNGRVVILSNDSALNYLCKYYVIDAKRIVKHNNQLFLNYQGENVIIKNYDSVSKNMYAASIFEPMISSCPCFIDKDNLDKVKKEDKSRLKIKREKKYDKKKIAASLLVAATLGVTTFGFTSDHDKNNDNVKKVKEVKAKAYTVQMVGSTAGAVEKTVKDAIPLAKEQPKVAEAKEEPKKEEKAVLLKEEPGQTIYIDYDDRSETTKAKNAHKYEDVIDKYADMYGLDGKLMLALATQERGEHGTVMDAGGATGLMQIQNSVWRNASLTAYNFDTNSWEKIVVDESKLSDLNYNVKVGCMIFQNYLNHNDCNVLQTIQSYNMGVNAVGRVVDQYAKDNNISAGSVRKHQDDLGWTSYLDSIPFGDRNYLTNVLSYCGDKCSLKFRKPDSNQIININITSEVKQKSKS